MVQPYGQPPQQSAYGIPPTQPIGMPQPEIKWSGLETGGAFHLPVIAFIGRLTDIVEDHQSTFGLRLVEKYDQVQILESPVPWPWATIEPSIKYSAKENSAWGKHIDSAKALGLAVSAATLSEAKADIIGKTYEMRQVPETYGEDRSTGDTMKGDVWKFVRIVQPGQAQAFPQPQYATPQPQPSTIVAAPAPAGVPTPTPAPTPAPAPQSASSTPTGAFNITLDPSDTAPIRAKKILHNKALNEWLGIALMDDKIKADAAFINTIYDQSFIVGLKASGQVTQEPDGKFAVIA